MNSIKRPTIYDLASLAEVSPATVSRVLNNKGRVSEKTRARVLELAHEVNLKPRASIRNKKVAIITEPRYSDRFRGYSNVLASHISFALSEQDVSIFLPSDPATQLSNYFIDAIICITCEPDIGDKLKALEKKIPVVYLDKFETTNHQYTVRSDHYQSGYLAAKYFIERGLKKPAFISGEISPAHIRLNGYIDAIKDAGHVPDEKLLFLMEPEESLYMVVNRTIKNGADALFTPGTSMQGIEAMHVLRNVMNLEIPADISLITGENNGISNYQHPPLTTIDEPLGKMAQTAVDMALALVDKKKVKERTVTFPVELIVRDSVR